MYKLKNKGYGTITVYDSKGIGYTLFPNDEIIIDRKVEENGVYCIEELNKTKKNKTKESEL